LAARVDFSLLTGAQLELLETSADLVDALEGERERSLLLDATELVGDRLLADGRAGFPLVGSFVLN